MKKGDILLIDVSESFDELGHFVHYSLRKEAMAGNHTLLIKPKNDKVISKYLYYLLRNQKSRIRKFATGDKVASISLRDFSSLIIDLPPINEQQEIIDIIEHNEKLFLSFSNCVRIDNYENAKSDMNELIDIIEPSEDYIKSIDKRIELSKSVLINLYNKRDKKIFMSDIIRHNNKKYNNQKIYAATNAFSELYLDSEKIVSITGKKPSRANLSPKTNSFIFSKLKGDNKVFYFKDRPEYVISTGFFNISTDFNDHILGFLLSEDFKNQKDNLSTGTTMQGITRRSLDSFKVNKPFGNNSEISIYLFKLIKLRDKLSLIKDQMTSILINNVR